MKFYQFFNFLQISTAISHIPSEQFTTFEFINNIREVEPDLTASFEGSYIRPNPLFGKILKLYMLSRHTIRIISKRGISPAVWQKV